MSPTKDEYSCEQHIIKMPDLDYRPDSRGLGYNYFQAMCQNKNKIAQIDSVTGQKQDYGTILEQSIRVAMHMEHLGVTSEDTISICAYNRLELCVPFIATMFLGAKMASLDPRLSSIYVTRLTEMTKPKLIFADASGIQLLEESKVNSQIITFDSNRKFVQFEEFLKPKEKEDAFKPFVVSNDMDTAVIFFTSGTTGFPKGICINHYSLLCQAYNFANVFGAHPEMTLSFSTLYWISGPCILTGLIMNGFCKIVCPQFDPIDVWYLIDKYKATCIFMSSVELIAMYKAGRPKLITTSSLKKLIFGGSSISMEVGENMKKLLPTTNISQGYGQTEVSGCLTCFDSNNQKDLELGNKKPLSCGKPMAGIWYKVVDPENGKILGPNQQGELRVKSNYQLNCFYKADTSEAFDEDGWLKTGDLVYYDEDLCFFIVDRLKEIFIYQAWFIAPAVIEHVLQMHPAVKNAVVLGIPHEDDISRALGVVVLNNEFSSVSPKELVRYVDERVEEKYRLTAGVKIVDNIPMTPTGKINRRTLKELILSEKL